MAAVVSFFSELFTGSQKHHSYKMLLIGETGSGKTSFLNLLCNCGSVEALGRKFDSDIIALFKEFNDIKLEDAQQRQMASKTSGAKKYNVEIGNLKVGIIDSPGFGDSRGFDQDKDNAKLIIDCLEAEEFLHCICLIINGRQARMSPSLQYVLTEITSILPREVLNNIIVVFTNTADPLDLNFDPSELQHFFGQKIDDHTFYVENPYCRLEKAKAKKKQLKLDVIAASLKKSFQETADVLRNMCLAMRDFKQLHTNKFVTLYLKKQEIEKSIMKLISAYDNQTQLEKAIEKAEEEAEAALKTKTLNNNFQTTQTIPKHYPEKTSRHNTLCGAPDCYSNCHVPCYLNKAMDKEEIRYCATIGGTNCVECGHHYTLHYHNEVIWIKKIETKQFVDGVMKLKFENARSMEEKARLFKEDMEAKRKQSEEEKAKLSHKLLLVIEEFQVLGIGRNYAKLLESQLSVINLRIKGSDPKLVASLRKTKDQLEKKLKLVQETLKQPWSRDTDPASQRQWACKQLGLKINPKEITNDIVNKAYKEMARVAHPDKSGDDQAFQRLARARDILLK